MRNQKPVAVLTGASTGIGYAVADRLARAGYSLVLGSRSPEEAANQLRADHQAEVRAVAGDLAEPETSRLLIAVALELGGIDALLLNHGGPPVKAFVEVSEQEWDQYFQLMVQGPLRLFREAVPLLRSTRGRVVAITSFTVKSPYPGIVLSNSLRAALVNALKTAAQELGPNGILVNAVAPGYIATERVINFNRAYADREGISLGEVDSRTLASIPLKHYGAPADVAELVEFLLSPRNNYVTGQQIQVDGGLVTAV